MCSSLLISIILRAATDTTYSNILWNTVLNCHYIGTYYVFQNCFFSRKKIGSLFVMKYYIGKIIYIYILYRAHDHDCSYRTRYLCYFLEKHLHWTDLPPLRHRRTTPTQLSKANRYLVKFLPRPLTKPVVYSIHLFISKIYGVVGS